MKIEENLAEKKPRWANAPFPVYVCPFCQGSMEVDYSMGCQLWTFECPRCLIGKPENDEVPQIRYRVWFWWGEHVGQNHRWVQHIINEDGTELEVEKIIINHAR